MPDYTTRMSISAAMWLSLSLSQPTCYLQDRDEIADDVIIVKSRNRYVKVTAVSVIHHGAIRHKPTGYRRIHKCAFSGRKSLNSHSFCPCSRLGSQHFALSGAIYFPCAGHFAGFLLRRYCMSRIYARFHSGFSFSFWQLKMQGIIVI